MVTNNCVKSNYDWLRIDEALGFWKSDGRRRRRRGRRRGRRRRGWSS